MSNIINGTATDYEMPANNYVTATTPDKHDYAENKGRNQEFYKDPTYISAAKRPYRNKDVPVYSKRHSRRYETIGLIMRICDLAGFELAERVVLRDKATGEVLK